MLGQSTISESAISSFPESESGETQIDYMNLYLRHMMVISILCSIILD